MNKVTRNVVTVIGGVAIAGLFVGGVAWGQSVLRFDPQPSPTATIQVAADPIETTLTLVLSPEATAVEGASVTATASVAPIVAGSVEFFDGVTSLGSSNIVAGASSVSAVLPVGAHSITAAFTPANGVAYAAAEADAVALTVTAAPPVVEDPVIEEPTPVRCPAGSTANQTDGVTDFSCIWDYCLSISVPNPDYPECDYAFEP